MPRFFYTFIFFGVRQQMVSSARDRSRQCRYTRSDSAINRPKLPNFINSHDI